MKIISMFGEDVFDGYQTLGYVDDTISDSEIINKLNSDHKLDLVSSNRSLTFYHLYKDINGKKVTVLIEPLVKFMLS